MSARPGKRSWRVATGDEVVPGRRVIERLDADLDADPAWIVMSRVDGPHLSALVRDDGPIEVEQAVPLARDVADALAQTCTMPGVCTSTSSRPTS